MPFCFKKKFRAKTGVKHTYRNKFYFILFYFKMVARPRTFGIGGPSILAGLSASSFIIFCEVACTQIYCSIFGGAERIHKWRKAFRYMVTESKSLGVSWFNFKRKPCTFIRGGGETMFIANWKWTGNVFI